MNFPLRAKIVGVMSTLLTIMLLVVMLTYYRASQIDKDLSFMVEKVIPTLNAMSVIEAHFLEQQIAYERLFRTMVTTDNTAATGEETLARIKYLGKLVDNEVAQAQSYLTADESYLSTHFMVDELIHITKLSGHLDVLEKEHEEFEQHIQEMIELREREQFQALSMLNRVLEEETDDVNDVMGQMQRILKNLSESEAYHVLEQERNLHFASLYVAILAFLTGVLVAPRIASRIIKPLKAMNQGAKQIAGGDLNVTIEVNTRDEVGELGLAFNQMAKELQAKERIKDTFGKYIDPRIVEQLLIEQENFDLTNTEKKVMTVFFRISPSSAPSQNRLPLQAWSK